MASASSIKASLNKSKSNKVKVAITDIDGILRGKFIHRDKFLSALEGGFGFCNVVFGWDMADVCYENTDYTGWHTGYPDAQAQLDPNTFRTIPWENNTPFMLGDFVDDKGKPLDVCPRQLLKGVIAQAKKQGYEARFGLEFEWFNFKETPQSLSDKGYIRPTPLTPGMFGYSLLRSGLNQDYFHALMDGLEAFGVPLEGLHTETGPGVFEAAILNAPALEAADRGALFKTTVKNLAYPFEIMPSFMAKWHPTLPGCSGHLHQSLWKGGKNVFYSASNKHSMSDLFESYLAGQMECLPEILPMYAPNINSYKRLVEGLWAPTRVTWGFDNRTVAHRVIPGSAKSTRLETRVPGSDMNPYLSVAAALASGLYGIRKKLKLKTKPILGNGYADRKAVRLPATLEDASDRMAKSKIAKELFGEGFVKHYCQTRQWEVERYRASVTDWETQRYFELV